MLAKYKILTVTHKSANLKAIGDFVVKATDEAELKNRLEAIKSRFQLDELLYLPTCNRVLYLFTASQPLDDDFAASFFRHINPELSAADDSFVTEAVQHLEGEAALEHLLEVAASIDSLVIGERQVLRQLREAFEQCWEWGLAGHFIRLA